MIKTGDAVRLMAKLPAGSVDVVWADPPYFLSSGGSTCRSGQRFSVDKGTWDLPRSPKAQLAWSREWMDAARHVLTPEGTIWVCGTMHSTGAASFALQLESYRLLNEITWEKPNPPPNLGCRCFTHSTEKLLWASKGKDRKHYFDYDAMKIHNCGRQMKDVWRFAAPGRDEKLQGKHPTQKPVALVERCLLASLPAGGTVLDPFMGSGTTGVATLLHPDSEWNFIGFDSDPACVALARKRIRAAALTN